MRKILLYVILITLFFSFLNANSFIKKKKILYINSYHSGLYWSDGIEKSIKDTLRRSGLPIQFKRIEMDTKRNKSESYKLKIALKIKKLIENFKPDVVITSDDNAVKYVIVPYFYNSSIPFVFCGVNASAKKYGLPTKNVTGMVEIQLIPQLIQRIRKYAKGDKIAYLKGDTLTSKIEASFFEEQLGQQIEKRFVTSSKEWMENYLELQDSVDMILTGNGAGVKDWDENRKKIKSFVRKNTKIPSGTWSAIVNDLVLFSYANKPEEQGKWAANTALDILKGKDISSIPLVANEEATIHINTTLGKKLKVVFPFDIIDNAVLVE